MYSLNVPVPGRVERLAEELRPALYGFETVRERHTLVVKRFDTPPASYDRLEKRVRRTLDDVPTFEARVTGIDAFLEPAAGPGPVVYLAVESPGLWSLHHRLTDAFDPIEGLEGDDYVPHITLARGGSVEATTDLPERSIEPIRWTVKELVFWDARYEEIAGTLSLPA